MSEELTSIWSGTLHERIPAPQLKADISADIAIVGGGITGLTAAHILGAFGYSVAVLEAYTVGSGTTGHSTGNLYSTVDEHLFEIEKEWGADRTAQVVASRAGAIDAIESYSKELAIECGFARCDFTIFSEDPEDGKTITDEIQASKRAGLNATAIEELGVGFENPFWNGQRLGNQAQLQPLAYVRGLAEHLPESVNLYENSPAIELDDKGGLVRCEGGTVACSHILVATHTPKGFHVVQTVLGPYREFGVAAVVPNGGLLPDGIYWQIGQRKRSFRRFVHQGEEYVMVIGDKFKVGQNDEGMGRVEELKQWLTTRFGQVDIRYVWGGQQYRPADGIPYIGRSGDKTHIMTGFSSDGLVYGTLAAQIVADDIAGRANPYKELYDINRFTPAKSAKDFAKENVNTVVKLIGDLWPKGHVAEDIAPGQGKVLEKGTSKIAASRDEHGNVTAVSAVCPHLKCIVHWNEVERTWDCPCHGSRFAADGEVLEGPALRGLTKLDTSDAKD